jgi:hypothetical protein
MTIFSWIGELFSETARHNAELYRSGRANRKEVRHTTVGWRRDPHNGEDGYTEDEGLTPSGNREYYRVIRRGDE